MEDLKNKSMSFKCADCKHSQIVQYKPQYCILGFKCALKKELIMFSNDTPEWCPLEVEK